MFSLGPQYYLHLYTLLVIILSVFLFVPYAHYPQSRLDDDKKASSKLVFLLAVLLIAFIGLRPVSGKYFVDMANYYAHYLVYQGDPFHFNWKTENILFDNLFCFLASKNVPVEYFFVSMAAIYFGCMAWACGGLFPQDKLTAFVVYLGAFSTYSYSTNGIKAGAAASLFLVALALYEHRRWLWMVVFLLLSWGFHHSMALPVAAFCVCLFVKNPRWYFLLWALCFIIAALHITYFQELFANIIDEKGSMYLSGDDGYVRRDILGGFRIDFILYSAVPIIVGWIAVYKRFIRSERFIFLLNLYILTNSIWLLCMYADFTNRIAYLSWLLFPIVLIYPFLKERWGSSQFKTFCWVALGHLGFTLFMNYIYT